MVNLFLFLESSAIRLPIFVGSRLLLGLFWCTYLPGHRLIYVWPKSGTTLCDLHNTLLFWDLHNIFNYYGRPTGSNIYINCWT